MSAIQTVTIINNSTVITDAEVATVIPVLQKQVSRDFAPIWGVGALLQQASAPSRYAWPLYILDTADVQGALGYHEDPYGIPDGKIFAKTTEDAGLNWTVTLSHELLEALADPTCMSVRPYWYYRYALEVGDPVESDEFGYTIDGVLVSDFITPAWFGPARRGAVYDFTRHCLAPRTILPAGYQLRWDPLRGWRQLVARQGVVQARKIHTVLDVTRRAGSSGRTLQRLRHQGR